MSQSPSSAKVHLQPSQVNCPYSGISCSAPGGPYWNAEDAGAPEIQDTAFPKKNLPDLFGIPTIGGMEFLKAKEIIRCEGMQRLTKVHTVDGVLLSSYNIGEFCRLLCGFGFFSPHKSHLINLQYLRRYHTNGAITLRDGACVPLARRRREMFLERVRHL